jgi:histone-lysine N-methyltransferase SETMAR
VLLTDILKKQRAIKANYYSKLLKDRVKAPFRSKRRGRSVKSVCLLHDNARPYAAAVTTGTLQETHWEVLPHPASSSDLAPSDFHMFGPLKETRGGEYLEPAMKLTFCAMMAGRATTNVFFFERDVMKVPESWRRWTEVQGEYIEKHVLLCEKM